MENGLERALNLPFDYIDCDIELGEARREGSFCNTCYAVVYSVTVE
jgi:hypothetical protein